MSNIKKRKSIIRNIAIFCILVTTVALISPLLGGSPTSFGPGFILWGAAPFLFAMVMRILTRDWSDAGFKPAFKKNAPLYAVSILASPVTMGLTLLTGAVFSLSSVVEFSMNQYLNTALPGLVIFFVFAIFEEFGWRGYLAPKLASLGINDFLAYALVAIVWATWHMPFIRELSWTYAGSENLLTFIPRFYLSCFAYSILYGELRTATGSVWPAVLVHCFTNSIQHPFAAGFLKIVPGMEYLVSFNGLFMTAFVGILGIALYLWRKRKTKKPNKPNSKMDKSHPFLIAHLAGFIIIFSFLMI